MTEEEQAGSASAAQLCMRCGLCCSGVIFDSVPVQKDELARLNDLDFEITQEGDGIGFRQPCRMFSDSLCSVYAARPGACRKFQCKLLRRHIEGGITGEEAYSLVQSAKSLAEKLRPFLQEGESVAHARKRWRLERQEVSQDDAATMDSGRARFHLSMASLNIFLDKHFRSDGQKVMTSQPLSGSAERSEAESFEEARSAPPGSAQ